VYTAESGYHAINKMEIVRCGRCNRKLAEAVYTKLSIKCPRCGVLNHLRAIEPLISTPRASSVEVKDGAFKR
jgi:phage FluMu protein Com